MSNNSLAIPAKELYAFAGLRNTSPAWEANARHSLCGKKLCSVRTRTQKSTAVHSEDLHCTIRASW